MRIFLVRHGESKANELKLYGSKLEIGLSEEGARQAERVAKRFANLDIGLIICSDQRRAEQTAMIIGKALGKTVTPLDLLKEWKFPSEFEGRGVYDAELAKIWDKIWDSSDPSWRYSDEETLLEVVERVRKAIDYIKSRKERSIITVTHNIFITMLLSVLLLGDDLNRMRLRKAFKFFRMENTGITEVEIDDSGNAKLITFNDFTHLK